MFSSLPNKISVINKCFLHTTCSLKSSISAKRQGTLLKKMLYPKSKRKWFEGNTNTLPAVKGLSNSEREPSKRGLKRVASLNKMFMKHITDLMSTGSTSMDVLGRGLEISKVKVSQDFNIVNVFWVTKGNDPDAETEAILSRVAGVLRHELSQLRVMGEVPVINFVKDNELAELFELDRRLAIADYGEDFTPTRLASPLLSDFTLDVELSDQLKEKIKEIDKEGDDNIDDEIPTMTHTVYGLDHARFTRRMLAARKKNLDAWGAIGNVPDSNVVSYRKETSGAETSFNYEEDRINLKEYLQKRQIAEDRLRKELQSKKIEDINLEENAAPSNGEEYYYDSDFDDNHDQEYEEGQK